MKIYNSLDLCILFFTKKNIARTTNWFLDPLSHTVVSVCKMILTILKNVLFCWAQLELSPNNRKRRKNTNEVLKIHYICFWKGRFIFLNDGCSITSIADIMTVYLDFCVAGFLILFFTCFKCWHCVAKPQNI